MAMGPHVGMAELAFAAGRDDATELTLLLAVRDRLHLADVLRAVKRSPPVLRASRIKP